MNLRCFHLQSRLFLVLQIIIDFFAFIGCVVSSRFLFDFGYIYPSYLLSVCFQLTPGPVPSVGSRTDTAGA